MSPARALLPRASLRGWCLVLACAALCAACARKAPPAGDRASSASASAAPSSPAASETTTEYHVPEPEGRTSFEVEFEGAVQGAVKGGARYVVLVSEQPCTPDNLGTVPTIAIGEARQKPKGRSYATEGNVREGSPGHVCATVLDDKGRAIGFGAYPKNPLTFGASGRDELALEGLDVTVTPLVPPRELPAGRF